MNDDLHDLVREVLVLINEYQHKCDADPEMKSVGVPNYRMCNVCEVIV